MQVEINGDAEKLIQAGLATGVFHTPEEAIAAMARVWAEATGMRATPERHLNPRTDISALAAAQGIRPFDPAAQRPGFWPQEESADEFLAFLRELRRDDATPEKRP